MKRNWSHVLHHHHVPQIKSVLEEFVHQNVKMRRQIVCTMRSAQMVFVSGFVAAISSVELDLSVLIGPVGKVVFPIRSVKKMKFAQVESVLVRIIFLYGQYVLNMIYISRSL